MNAVRLKIAKLLLTGLVFFFFFAYHFKFHLKCIGALGIIILLEIMVVLLTKMIILVFINLFLCLTLFVRMCV